MTYHEFLRAVMAAINRPGRPIDGGSFDRAVVAGLERMRPDLHKGASEAGVLDSVTTLMHYLEAHWSPADTEQHPQGAPTS